MKNPLPNICVVIMSYSIVVGILTSFFVIHFCGAHGPIFKVQVTESSIIPLGWRWGWRGGGGGGGCPLAPLFVLHYISLVWRSRPFTNAVLGKGSGIVLYIELLLWNFFIANLHCVLVMITFYLHRQIQLAQLVYP